VGPEKSKHAQLYAFDAKIMSIGRTQLFLYNTTEKTFQKNA